MERQARTGGLTAGLVLVMSAALAAGASEPTPSVSSPSKRAAARPVERRVLRFDDLNGSPPLVPVAPRRGGNANDPTVRNEPTLAPPVEARSSDEARDGAEAPAGLLKRLPPLDQTAPSVAPPPANKYPTPPIPLYPDTGYDPWTPRIKVNVAAVLEGVARTQGPADAGARPSQR